jgi:hypothetical protein
MPEFEKKNAEKGIRTFAGVVMSPTNSVSPQNLPFFVKPHI